MGRPIPGPDGAGRFCPLGRETGMERVVWGEDDWLYLEGGGMLVRGALPGLADVEQAPPKAFFTDFSDGTLPPEFQWLRSPNTGRLFELRDGALTLYGRESMGSWFEQALVARRQEHFAYTAETEVAFDPVTYQQTAGLATYYNRFKFHMLLVTDEPGQGRSLTIVSCLGDFPDGKLSFALPKPQPCPDGPIQMKVEVDHALQHFSWRKPGGAWQNIGPKLDAAVISDEGGRGGHGSFTGAFVGMFAMDMTGQGREARFSHFAYRPEGA